MGRKTGAKARAKQGPGQNKDKGKTRTRAKKVRVTQPLVQVDERLRLIYSLSSSADKEYAEE